MNKLISKYLFKAIIPLATGIYLLNVNSIFATIIAMLNFISFGYIVLALLTIILMYFNENIAKSLVDENLLKSIIKKSMKNISLILNPICIKHNITYKLNINLTNKQD